MPQFLTLTNTLPHTWSSVTQAVWQKYPNPFASHVLSSDVIDRQIDPQTGVMTTTRLFLKKGHTPKWSQRLFNVRDAYILEQSIVNPHTKTLTTITRNLSHTKIMLVEETQTYTPMNDSETSVRTDVRIISNTGWGSVKSRIEGFGLNKFKERARESKMGLLFVVERLKGGRVDVGGGGR